MPKLRFLTRAGRSCPVFLSFPLAAALSRFSLSSSPSIFLGVDTASRSVVTFTSPVVSLSVVLLFFKKALLKIGAKEFEVNARLDTMDELLLALLRRIGGRRSILGAGGRSMTLGVLAELLLEAGVDEIAPVE